MPSISEPLRSHGFRHVHCEQNGNRGKTVLDHHQHKWYWGIHELDAFWKTQKGKESIAGHILQPGKTLECEDKQSEWSNNTTKN